ncbi:MAG TPA: GFA family protein [Pseudomonadales bacterium]|nr:GFA family protein [Pseudomonadales bacterium]
METFEGQCFCGAIGWSAELDPARIAICHCRDCQIFGGAAFRLGGAVAPDRFRITRGMPKRFTKQTARGTDRTMLFCCDCGTHLAGTADDPDAYVTVRVATSARAAELRPAGEVFCDSALAWMPPIEGTLRFPRMP